MLVWDREMLTEGHPARTLVAQGVLQLKLCDM